MPRRENSNTETQATIRIEYYRSFIAAPKTHKTIVRSLGLTKLRQIVERSRIIGCDRRATDERLKDPDGIGRGDTNGHGSSLAANAAPSHGLAPCDCSQITPNRADRVRIDWGRQCPSGYQVRSTPISGR